MVQQVFLVMGTAASRHCLTTEREREVLLKDKAWNHCFVIINIHVVGCKKQQHFYCAKCKINFE